MRRPWPFTCVRLSLHNIVSNAHSRSPHGLQPMISHSFYFAPHTQISKYATTPGKEMVGVPQLVITSDVYEKPALTLKGATVLCK